jgi:hypothetical protein
MAREWETPQAANSLDYVENAYLNKVSTRRYLLDQRRFYPEKLEGFDDRMGTNRRYMRGYNIYLRKELQLRNREGLQGWNAKEMM